MKKIISLFFVFIMCLSLCLNVSAGGNTGLINNMYYIEPDGFKKMNSSSQDALYFDGYKEVYISCISGLEDVIGFNRNTKSIKAVREDNLLMILDNMITEEKLKNEMYYVPDGVTISTKINSKDTKFVTNQMNVDMYVYEVTFTNKAYGYTDYKGCYKVILMVNGGNLYMIEYGRKEADTLNLESLSNLQESIIFEDVDYTNVIKILVNGNYVTPDSNPVIVNDRTLVPIRAVAEELNYEVSWIPENRQVDIYNGEIRLNFIIDSNIMVKRTMESKVSTEIDVPAQIISDRTYLPLRAVGEALGCDVDWDAENRTVIINEK